MPMRDLRRNYNFQALERQDLADDPFVQFHNWFEEASRPDNPDWLEMNAMTLATYDAATGQVFARVVLLKHVDQQGFMFFTNYNSDKGQQLAGHPKSSLVFYWPQVERQVRIQGTIEKTDRATSERYFHERPRSSQLGAAASQQSRSIPDRQVLLDEVARLDALYAGQEVPCPMHWGGYLMRPHEIEFWQGRSDRLHDRFIYRLSSDRATWTISRLSP